MFIRNRRHRRCAAILPLAAIALIGLLGCVALAIDLGMIATARGQCQNAADAAALAGARTLNGDVANNNNYSTAAPNALAAAMANSVFSQSIQSSQVTVEIGSYTYDEGQNQFVAMIPRDPNDNWNLVKATVNFTNPTAFAKVFNINAFNTTATATATHRPRDVAVILDFSGSMRFDSLLGIPYWGNRTMSNNSESVYPLFGHYSATASAALQNTSVFTQLGSEVYGSSNVTVTTASGPPIVEDFYQNASGQSSAKAFSPPDVALPPDTYAATPGSDIPLYQNGTTNYAQTTQQITGGKTFIGYTQPPYTGYGGPAVAEFQGYTQGPRYWGKTFFIWPPDPRSGNDWRQKFFGGSDNTKLWDASGNWRAPSGTTYTINYNAILNWIKNTGPNPFPPRLRSGRILYYDAIPDSIPASPWQPTDPNQRFWKEYIDHVLGVEQTGPTTYSVVTAQTGYGNDYTWGTIRITPPPTDPAGNVNKVGGYPASYSGAITVKNFTAAPRIGHRVYFGTDTANEYTINAVGGTTSITLDRPLAAAIANNAAVNLSTTKMPYLDNPKRPKLHFWFGPMTMIDFLGNYNRSRYWWPGTCHESPTYQTKLGIQAALDDMKNNHPNDNVSVMVFSTPQYSAGGSGQFNRVRGPLGRKYTRMKDSLWFPPDTIIDDVGTAGPDIRPYDTANDEAPRAKGGTSPVMGFMLAYNQFSAHPSLKTYSPPPSPSGEAGGLGRKGAQKMIIFETDGMANTPAAANFTNAGPYNSFYHVRQPGEFPSASGTVDTQLYGVVDQVCALDSVSPPGYSTARKPVLIHCLAFGTIFEPSSTDPSKADALTLLQTIQYKGKTQDAPTTPLPDYKMIVGTGDQRINKLRQAFIQIMQDGIPVSLIE